MIVSCIILVSCYYNFIFLFFFAWHLCIFIATCGKATVYSCELWFYSFFFSWFANYFWAGLFSVYSPNRYTSVMQNMNQVWKRSKLNVMVLFCRRFFQVTLSKCALLCLVRFLYVCSNEILQMPMIEVDISLLLYMHPDF